MPVVLILPMLIARPQCNNEFLKEKEWYVAVGYDYLEDENGTSGLRFWVIDDRRRLVALAAEGVTIEPLIDAEDSGTAQSEPELDIKERKQDVKSNTN